MAEARDRDNETILFLALAVLGTAAYFLRVNIPHTSAFIDGRWTFGYMGFALLRRRRSALLLAVLLSIPYVSKVSFLTGLGGNLAYALPTLVTIRLLHRRYLSRLKRHRTYMLAWFLLVLLCYQAFTTPIIWSILAYLRGTGIGAALPDGWRTQPFLVESLVVAMVSASGMLVFRARRELLQSRSELAITLDSIGDGVIATDIQGRILRMNSVAADLTGWDRKKVSGRRFTDVFRIADAKNGRPAENPVEKVLRTRQISRLKNHMTLVTRNGAEVQIADTAAPIFNEKKELVGVVVVFRDMTVEYESARELRESEEKYRILVNNANESIFVAQDGAIKFINPKTLEITGYSNSELAGASFVSMIYPEDREMVLEKHRRRLAGENFPNTYSFRIVQKSGEILWVQLNTVAITWEGRPATLNFLRDITQLRKLEGQLQQAQKMEAIGNLAGGIAHDYNNISSIIIGYTELALARIDPANPLHSDLTGILTAAERSTDITRQLLAFARQQTIEPRVIDLNDIVGNMMKMLRRLIGEDIDLAWMPGTDLWPVRIDPSQIDQILANLCVNARDAIVNVGKVTIETKNIRFDEEYCADHSGFVPGDFVLLSVSDNGVGIPPETMDKIFDPFFTTKKFGKGTGLGLSTVYGIIKQNDGFINAYSEPEQGTTIKVYFPRHSGPVVELHREGVLETPVGRGETVLLVEDDAPILDLVKRILESLKYFVLSAATPREAIELAERHAGEIHLLITDVVMPEMNGRELAELLQSRYAGIQTLFMSGYTANVIAHRGVLEEGVLFIPKPFSRKHLAEKIREALDNIPGRRRG